MVVNSERFSRIQGIKSSKMKIVAIFETTRLAVLLIKQTERK